MADPQSEEILRTLQNILPLHQALPAGYAPDLANRCVHKESTDPRVGMALVVGKRCSRCSDMGSDITLVNEVRLESCVLHQ